MQLTFFTDYSLRVLVFLGAHPGRLCTIPETADAYGISGNHLRKIVNHLSSVGYIEPVPGRGGGMGLPRPPNITNIGVWVPNRKNTSNIVKFLKRNPQPCP